MVGLKKFFRTWKRQRERDGSMELSSPRFDGQDRADGATLLNDLLGRRVFDLGHRQSDVHSFDKRSGKARERE